MVVQHLHTVPGVSSNLTFTTKLNTLVKNGHSSLGRSLRHRRYWQQWRWLVCFLNFAALADVVIATD